MDLFSHSLPPSFSLRSLSAFSTSLLFSSSALSLFLHRRFLSPQTPLLLVYSPFLPRLSSPEFLSADPYSNDNLVAPTNECKDWILTLMITGSAFWGPTVDLCLIAILCIRQFFFVYKSWLAQLVERSAVNR